MLLEKKAIALEGSRVGWGGIGIKEEKREKCEEEKAVRVIPYLQIFVIFKSIFISF